ncbi:hypothetical protein ACEPPN_005622 [Leptodophora sp. 'Broadleaf-Isolate-01']
MSLPVRRVYMLLCVLGISALCSAQINLGEAKSYGILGRLSVTNTGSTVINGGLRTGGTSVTGFYPPGIVNGNIVLGDATGAAFLDATAAYTNITAATPAVDLTGSDLGGMNLRPGTYTFSSTAQLTGTLTLNGTGSPNDQWYFQIGKALTTASAAAVIFVNGGKACRVYWAVGSAATLGTGKFDNTSSQLPYTGRACFRLDDTPFNIHLDFLAQHFGRGFKSDIKRIPTQHTLCEIKSVNESHTKLCIPAEID